MTESRVCILRPDNLGDVVLFSGALRHIRDLYPQAKITLCVKRFVRNLLQLCPHIDRLVSWESLSRPVSGRLERFRGGRRLGRRLGWLDQIALPAAAWFHRYDVILAPVRSPLAPHHAIVRRLRAGRGYGIAGDLGNEKPEEDYAAESAYTGRLRLTPDRQDEHELEVTADFIRFLGGPTDIADIWPEFWTSDADRAWAIRQVPTSDSFRTIALCPGVVANQCKLYPPERYAEVLTVMGEQVNVVLMGSAAERSICDAVGTSLRECSSVAKVINLAGRSTIRQMIEAMNLCDAVISTDTAALHIAVGLKKPVVGIMGGGHLGRFYPWGDPAIHRVANAWMDCYGCRWNCKYASPKCMEEISPQAIASQLIAAIGESARRRSRPPVPITAEKSGCM